MPMRKSDYEAALKIDYMGSIVDLLENATAFTSRAERWIHETGGKHIHIPLRNARTTSIGARGDTSNDGDLPVGATPGYTQATFGVKPQYATIRVTGFAMRTSRRPDFAFARAQVRDMEDTMKDFKKDINRQMFGVGEAILCRTVTTGNTTTFVVSNDFYPTRPTKFLSPNMKVDVKIASTLVDATSGNSRTLSSINKSTNTIVLDAAVNVGSTTGLAAIYREDNTYATGTVVNEYAGLLGAVDSANPNAVTGTASLASTPVVPNFGAIDRSSTEEWGAQVLDNSGTLRPFSVHLVEQGIDAGEEEAGGETTLIQTNYAIFRIYGALLIAAKQYDGNAMELDGGFKALSVNGIPMVRDVDAPDYTIFCLDESTFYLGVTGDWAWLEDDAGGILSRISGKDEYEGVLNRDMVLMCDAPPKNTKIKDVSHN